MSRTIKRISLAIGALVLAGTAVFWWLASGKSVDTESQSSPARQQALSVRAVEARIGSVQAWVFAEGTARSVQRHYLTFENPGRVVYIKRGKDGVELREGSRVRRGDILARQDQRNYKADIQTAQSSRVEAKTQVEVAAAELDQAKTEYELAQATLRRFATLIEQNSASRQEYDEARASAAKAKAAVESAQSRLSSAQAQVSAAEAKLAQTRTKLEETELRAPIDGVLAYLNIEVGYYFMPSLLRTDSESALLQTIPMVVIDPAQYEIAVNVPSYVQEQVAVGQTTFIGASDSATDAASMGAGTPLSPDRSPELALESFPVRGEVFSVNPAVSPGGRAIQVKIRTTKNSARLKDGMFVTVWIATDERKDVVVAPLDVFLYRDNQPYVFVVDPQAQTARLREVSLGLQSFTKREIRSGVKAGELLVSDGRFQLSDGTVVSVLGGDSRSAMETN